MNEITRLRQRKSIQFFYDNLIATNCNLTFSLRTLNKDEANNLANNVRKVVKLLYVECLLEGAKAEKG